MRKTKIIIIGGGLAGLTLALDLLKKGIFVTIVEKGEYPRQKVCGEYISNEVLPYLRHLGISPYEWGAVEINILQFSNISGKVLHSELPQGGFGISRYLLDNNLYHCVKDAGGKIIREKVNAVCEDAGIFSLELASGDHLQADLVIGAYGKRSNLDIELSRSFIKKKSQWLAVKSHYKGYWDSRVVGLHNFNGGYCGISKVENDKINVCYLADFHSFQQYRDLERYTEKVVCANPHLNSFFQNAHPLFEKPVTISQISFDEKERVHDHILMCGDSASLIHPLCGNGMAMAIHAAQLLANEIEKYLTCGMSREDLEKNYKRAWDHQFKSRLFVGRSLQGLLINKTALNLGMHVMRNTPFLFRQLI